MEEQLSESNVVASRLWKQLLAEAPNTIADIDLTYRHALFVMHLYAMRDNRAHNDALARQIWTRDTPGGAHARSDEALRERSVYSWLVEELPRDYLERLQRAYFAMLDWLGRPTRFGPSFEKSASSWLAHHAQHLQGWLRSVNERQLLYAFDQGIAKLVRSEVDIGRERFAAELAASSLSDSVLNIGDLTGTTGRFALGLHERVSAFGSCLLGSKELISEVVDLRFKMLSIDFLHSDSALPGESGQVSWPFKLDMLLVNPTPRGAKRKAATNPRVTGPVSEATAIEWAYRLCRGSTRFRFALVVVPQIDCVSSKWSRDVREGLVETGRVAAVVDFPRAASDTGNANFSAWLLRGDEAAFGNSIDDILFIDAQPLSLLTPGNQTAGVAHFIGTMLAARVAGPQASPQAVQRLDEEAPFLAGIFSQEFTPDNFGSPGLSRHVSLDEVRGNGFALTAKTYVRTVDDGPWVHRLDRRQLDSLLHDSSSFGKRMYVIGNNGKGKSILLRDVAEVSTESKRLTIAIASGASDRFPLRGRGKHAASYKYRGARTSARGVNSIQTAVEAARLMLAIYFDQIKLDVFEEVVELIGFTSEQFLIPKDARRGTNVSDSAIRGIARLASQSDEDSFIINNLRRHPEEQKKYKLGLRRQRDADGITPFDELSSGEQQIVLLVAKMVSEAEAGCLFLVDEPEISLHVSWQRAIPKLFQIIAQSFNVDVLVATHSPVVIASADNEGDFCFTINNRTLVPLEHANRRSVETTLFEGFRTHTPNNREVHERCASLVADFIDIANQSTVDENPEKYVLEQLDEMKKIVAEQERFDRTESVAFDMRLIERAQAAIHEILEHASPITARDAE
ncbi:AAA family ATPase [Cupriavidus basilensis]|uniref:AAA family ATPase n=1 Tax=Cupriavidus basilensis TaxID=68895 RepID=UPI0023E7DAB7|nr:AAA family ATPase [Cupriavidus basilensis]MDF3883373.1 AAA family ATPase [Cupriavidus basilensis]